MNVVLWDINSQYYQGVPMALDCHLNEVARVLYIVISVFFYFVAKAEPNSMVFFIPLYDGGKDERVRVFLSMFEPGILISCRHRISILCSTICNMICSR